MPDVYQLSLAKDEDETYSDGTVVPHRFQWIERQHVSSDNIITWERVGYIEIHLHKVKRDETDIEDISLGFTGRINVKK